MAAALNWVVGMFAANCSTMTLDSCSSRSDKRPEEQRKQNLQRFVMRHDTVRKRWPFRGPRSLSARFHRLRRSHAQIM